MKKVIYIILGIGLIILIIAIFKTILSGFGNIGNTSGGYHSSQPYYITTEPTVVKNITVPKGSIIEYYLSPFAEGRQNKMLEEKDISSIELLNGKTIDWGGILVTGFKATGDFIDGSNTKGFAVSISSNQLNNTKKTKFAELCQSCNNSLSLLVKFKSDWSFNINNISDIDDCGRFQRYYKDDKEQQQFLNKLYIELQNVNKK